VVPTSAAARVVLGEGDDSPNHCQDHRSRTVPKKLTESISVHVDMFLVSDMRTRDYKITQVGMCGAV
jgi:hypothetical protein